MRRFILALLLSPISFLYGLGVSFRNMLYDAEVIKASRFSLPLIGVGNLSIGGAGKTPHIEYLIRLLAPYLNVATLSRGYNRSTTGFRFVTAGDTALISGDEPLMYARKFPGLTVAVCENRALGIPQMLQRYPGIQTILLDDAFQHRSVKPFIQILLTPFDHPFTRDYLLPGGRLREWRSAYSRANVIIVTKCPDALSQEQRDALITEIAPKDHQKIFFTRYRYGRIYQFYDGRYTMEINQDHDVLLISAIANTAYLNEYLKKTALSYSSIEFEDHHYFTEKDADDIIRTFFKRESKLRYVLTTEKDAVRLLPFRQKLLDAKVPVFVLPVEVEFLLGEGEAFNNYIKQSLLDFTS